MGTFHKMSKAHLHRFVAESEGRHTAQGRDTIDQMAATVRGDDGRRLRSALIEHGHNTTAILGSLLRLSSLRLGGLNLRDLLASEQPTSKADDRKHDGGDIVRLDRSNGRQCGGQDHNRQE